MDRKCSPICYDNFLRKLLVIIVGSVKLFANRIGSLCEWSTYIIMKKKKEEQWEILKHRPPHVIYTISTRSTSMKIMAGRDEFTA